MTTSEIQSNLPASTGSNQGLENQAKFTQINLAKKTQPSILKALATSIALFVPAVIVCLAFPIFKLAGLAPTTILKNIGEEILRVWGKTKDLESIERKPSQEEIESEIINAIKAPNQSDALGRLRESYMKKYEKKQIITDLEKLGSKRTNGWNLTIRGQEKAFQIPKMYERVCDRFPIDVTINARKKTEVMSEKTYDDLSLPIPEDVEDREKIIQRKSMELMLNGLLNCSSLRSADQIDPNLLCLFTPNAPCFSLTSYFAALPACVNTLEDLEFKAEKTLAFVEDVCSTELRIVYTGSIAIQDTGAAGQTQIGSIEYRKTLVLKKEGTNWVDTSFGGDKYDHITLQMNGKETALSLT